MLQGSHAFSFPSKPRFILFAFKFSIFSENLLVEWFLSLKYRCTTDWVIFLFNNYTMCVPICQNQYVTGHSWYDVQNCGSWTTDSQFIWYVIGLRFLYSVKPICIVVNNNFLFMYLKAARYFYYNGNANFWTARHFLKTCIILWNIHLVGCKCTLNNSLLQKVMNNPNS